VFLQALLTLLLQLLLDVEVCLMRRLWRRWADEEGESLRTAVGVSNVADTSPIRETINVSQESAHVFRMVIDAPVPKSVVGRRQSSVTSTEQIAAIVAQPDVEASISKVKGQTLVAFVDHEGQARLEQSVLKQDDALFDSPRPVLSFVHEMQKRTAEPVLRVNVVVL